MYPITLRLTDDNDSGLQATRVLRVSVFKNPARTALEMFVAEIASGRQWLDGVDNDWDNDDTPNPYDWTPDSVEVDGVMVEVNLTLNGVDPWPIYNVWQLQAIDGMSVSDGGVVTANSGLFGGSRLSRKYRLALDIDATPTRDWNDGGFRPIGVDRPGNNNADRFVGSLDGAGYEIRGLSVSASGNNYAGVFSAIGETGSVVSLQFSDVFVSGGGDGLVGGLVANNHGLVSLVGMSGRVVHRRRRSRRRFGGENGKWKHYRELVCGRSQIGHDGDWNDSFGIGGLIGDVGISGGTGGGTDIYNIWANARVEERNIARQDVNIGGLIGRGLATDVISGGWTGSEVIGNNPGGLMGRADADFEGATPQAILYFDVSTSGVNKDDAVARPEDVRFDHSSAETMVTVDDDSWDTSDVWIFGNSDFGGGDIAADYPFLQRYETMRPGAQAVAYATRQIRLRAGDAEATPGEVFMLDAGGELTLDTNGLADNQAPSPSCVFDSASGEVRAETNYNNVRVTLRATNGAVLSLPDADNCGVGYPGDGSTFSILAIVSAGDAAETISYSFAVAAGPVEIDAPAEAVVVAADSGAVLVTTFALRSGVAMFDAVTGGDLQTGGGDEAAVTLARSAALAFASDGLTLSLTLTAIGNGVSGTATIRFVSAPRAISQGDLPIVLLAAQAALGNEILAAGAASISIWHNGDNSETYSVESAGDNFGVDPTTGLVTVLAAGGLSAGDYAVILRLTDDTDTDGDFQATRRLLVKVAANPQEAVLTEFSAAIARADFNWFAANLIVGEGTTLDWDGDGIPNPYDWTPTSVAVDGPGMVAVNLTLDGSPDGSAGNPWPIYNVWQLQAIDGISVSGDGTTVTAKIERIESDGTTVTLDFAFFGDSESERLGAHYRLATHIDATPTRDWVGGGFRPIGGAECHG